MLAQSELWRMLYEKTQRENPDLHPMAREVRSAKRVIDWAIRDVLQETEKRLNDCKPKSPEEIRNYGYPVAAFGVEAEGLIGSLQEFLMANLYRHPRMQQREVQAEKLLKALFDSFISHPELLPERYSRRIESQGLHRVVCDYIAGMTDSYLEEEVERIGKILPT
jgi:dGTPase